MEKHRGASCSSAGWARRHLRGLSFKSWSSAFSQYEVGRHSARTRFSLQPSAIPFEAIHVAGQDRRRLRCKTFEDWVRSFSDGGTLPELHGYRSISNVGRYYLSLSSTDWYDALKESSQLLGGLKESGAGGSSLQIMEVERDYGMEVRDQAPQFFRAPERSVSGGRC